MSQINTPKKRPKEYQVIIYSSRVESRPLELKVKVKWFWTAIGFFIVLFLIGGVVLTWSTGLKNFAPGVVSVEKYEQDVTRNKIYLDSLLLSIQAKTDYFSKLRAMLPTTTLDTVNKLSKITDDGVLGESSPRIKAALSEGLTDATGIDKYPDHEFTDAEDYTLDGSAKTGLATSDKKTTIINYNSNGENELFVAFPPINGVLTRGIIQSLNHFGIDIATKKGTPVTSVSGGLVVFSDWTQTGGNTIIILHKNNYISVYKHLSIISTKENNVVQAGEMIGLSGSSGDVSTGPHLHLELWNSGKYLNPLDFISGWENK